MIKDHQKHFDEFRSIIKKYKLEAKADEIAERLIQSGISHSDFASEYNMTIEEADIFFEFIQKGIAYREKHCGGA